MSWLVWILLILAAISFVVLAFVIGRHWNEIRLLDPDSIREERVRKKRDEIVAQRLDRIKSGFFTPIAAAARSASVRGKIAFHGTYIKLLKLDRFYRQTKNPQVEIPRSDAERLKSTIEEARSLARDLKYGDAERKYLEVLGLDKRNVEAYKGLAALYLKQKMLPQAKETFEFLLRTTEADDACYAGLAEIAEEEGDVSLAERMYRKAAEMSPKCPNRHADLATFYLEHNETEKAWTFARRAMELEPKSIKYLELCIETAIRNGEKSEAVNRFDRFRMRSEDRQKIQSLKERIDAIH
ncbi:MAG: tetratricopeptide repeat protein [Patescibacteria group bacterium]